MRLLSVRIENFRSFKDETVTFDNYTCLVGPNGTGKSTVLNALNIFFRHGASSATSVSTLSEEDFHYGDTSSPIQITLTFGDLSAEAQEDLKHYYRQGGLVVSAKAVWRDDKHSADVLQFGIRNVMRDFAPYFKGASDGAKAADLKAIYEDLQGRYPDLPDASSGPAREATLREYEESHPSLCEAIESDAQFFGFTKGGNLLEKYLRWVYIPAVKDASTEQQEGSKGALKELLDRTVRSKVNFDEPIKAIKNEAAEKYKVILADKQDALDELRESLHERLRGWSGPTAELHLGWHYDDQKSVVVNEPNARASIGEDNFVGSVARLGHGMQRSFLVSLLHELALLNSAQGPTLLLGFEEPELYQHPPQAQHNSNVLEVLAETSSTNTQVVVSTHSPYFVSARGFESVRLVRKHPQNKCSLVASTTYTEVEAEIARVTGDRPDPPSATMASLEQIMQPSQREMYFSKTAVLVEGLEDVGYISSHLVVRNLWHDFRKAGCHFVVCGGKRSMSRPLIVAKQLCIRAYPVIDGDTDKANKEEMAKDNRAILRICGLEEADSMPPIDFISDNCTVWSTSITNAVREEAGQTLWSEVDKVVRAKRGFDGVNCKSKLYVAAMIEELANREFCSNALQRLCLQIIAFAELAPDDVPTTAFRTPRSTIPSAGAVPMRAAAQN